MQVFNIQKFQLCLYLNVHVDLPVSHVVPVNPVGHSQVNLSAVFGASLHVPPFSHWAVVTQKSSERILITNALVSNTEVPVMSILKLS